MPCRHRRTKRPHERVKAVDLSCEVGGEVLHLDRHRLGALVQHVGGEGYRLLAPAFLLACRCRRFLRPSIWRTSRMVMSSESTSSRAC